MIDIYRIFKGKMILLLLLFNSVVITCNKQEEINVPHDSKLNPGLDQTAYKVEEGV